MAPELARDRAVRDFIEAVRGALDDPAALAALTVPEGLPRRQGRGLEQLLASARRASAPRARRAVERRLDQQLDARVEDIAAGEAITDRRAEVAGGAFSAQLERLLAANPSALGRRSRRPIPHLRRRPPARRCRLATNSWPRSTAWRPYVGSGRARDPELNRASLRTTIGDQTGRAIRDG